MEVLGSLVCFSELTYLSKELPGHSLKETATSIACTGLQYMLKGRHGSVKPHVHLWPWINAS